MLHVGEVFVDPRALCVEYSFDLGEVHMPINLIEVVISVYMALLSVHELQELGKPSGILARVDADWLGSHVHGECGRVE